MRYLYFLHFPPRFLPFSTVRTHPLGQSRQTVSFFDKEWDALETDYVLGDQDTSKILVFADFVGKVIICFDKVKFIEKGTFAKIDEMKRHKNELGYSKGFKPSFRPVEGSPVRGNKLENDVIYIISRTREDLLKYFDCLKAMILEIDSNLIVELFEYPR